MVTEIKDASDKKLKIVFKNINSHTHAIEEHIYIQKKAKVDRQHTNKAAMNKKYEEIMNLKVDYDIWAELQGPTERQNRKLRDVAMAVKMANQRENLGTDKFLQDVESMVTVFKTELDKMQELFGNIMKKLPQVYNVPLT